MSSGINESNSNLHVTLTNSNVSLWFLTSNAKPPIQLLSASTLLLCPVMHKSWVQKYCWSFFWTPCIDYKSLYMGYKSLCAMVMIYADSDRGWHTDTHTHTHRKTDRQHSDQLIWTDELAELKKQKHIVLLKHIVLMAVLCNCIYKYKAINIQIDY